MAMYKQYFNAYEKKAEEIRRAARAVESTVVPQPESAPRTAPPASEASSLLPIRLPDKLDMDDILLMAILFLLLSNEKKDTTLILILGYLFFTGL
ncbi:MAG: hypothetical protein PUB07_00125 [Clostridia bacterium]|nr:hypothetical protein [Clostridia bacterium]